jgi:hypothetical protein
MLLDIAFYLKVPLDTVLNKMSYIEFKAWIEYFERRPYGWQEDLRTAYIMKSFGDKRPVQEIFPSLVPLFAARKELSAADAIRAAPSLVKMLRGAQGGDDIDMFKEYENSN